MVGVTELTREVVETVNRCGEAIRIERATFLAAQTLDSSIGEERAFELARRSHEDVRAALEERLDRAGDRGEPRVFELQGDYVIPKPHRSAEVTAIESALGRFRQRDRWPTPHRADEAFEHVGAAVLEAFGAEDVEVTPAPPQPDGGYDLTGSIPLGVSASVLGSISIKGEVKNRDSAVTDADVAKLSSRLDEGERGVFISHRRTYAPSHHEAAGETVDLVTLPQIVELARRDEALQDRIHELATGGNEQSLAPASEDV